MFCELELFKYSMFLTERRYNQSNYKKVTKLLSFLAECYKKTTLGSVVLKRLDFTRFCFSF